MLADARRRDAHAEQALLALFEHTRDHFYREDAAMERTGFPAEYVHRSEHSRVLHEFATEVASFKSERDRARLRWYLEQAMTPWFTQHIQTMDHVTALWISRHEP